MSANCLVTKLKATVNNSNLEKLGVLKLTLNVASVNDLYVIRATEDDMTRMTIISGPENGQIQKFVSASSREDLGQSCFIKNENTGGYYFSVIGTYVIELSNKQYIRMLDTKDTSVNLEKLQFLHGLTSLNMKNNVVGDISNLAGLMQENLTNITLSYCPNIEGSISDLDFSAITTFNLQHSSLLSGNISVINGKTSLQTFVVRGTNIVGDISNLAGCTAASNIQMGNSGISGSLSSLLENGHKKNPNLSILLVTNTPNLTKNETDVSALQSDGVSVYV